MLELNKKEFTELIIALEQRWLNMWLEVIKEVWFEKIDEVPEKVANKIEEFEELQNKIYSYASNYWMQDMFEIEESINKLVIKYDSELFQMVIDSFEKMENAVTYEMIVRKYMIEEWQKIKDEFWDNVKYLDIQNRIEFLSETIYKELFKNWLKNITLNID